MIKVKQNNWFWILQLIGWGIPGSLNTFGAWITTDINKNYLIVKGFLFLFAGIIASTMVRYYLKKRVKFEKFQNNEIKIILIAWLIGTIIFVLLLLPDIYIYTLFYEEKHETTSLEIISTIANATLFILFWLVFYIAIKVSRNFRQNRMERLKLKATLKESQLNTLKGQINPHFMFNSLNNIRGLMLEDVDKSREMITRLSEMLRYSLTKNSLDKIALTEELEMVENYIALSKIQLEDRLDFTKEIDKTVLKTEIPPMLVQMLIENAIKHGISNLPKGGKVNLKIIKEANNLIIEVANTGKLIIDKTSTKVGLENIKKRLSLLYQNKASFSLLEIKENVVAKIVIPV